MKSLTAGTVSGCIVWGVLFVVTVPCLWVVMFMVLDLNTYTDTAYHIMQPIVCPSGSKLTVKVYDSTTTDSSHHRIAAVGHDMNCDANGDLVKKDVIVEYLLIWRGLGIVSGVVGALLLSFLLSIPVGALVIGFMHRTKATPTPP